MKIYELRRLLRETGEAANELMTAFQQMADNTNEKRERQILEKLKRALFEYKSKQILCLKNGLEIRINIEPAAITLKVNNPSFDILLTKQDLKILKKMKISIEGLE